MSGCPHVFLLCRWRGDLYSVNRRVAGSNPARGANPFNELAPSLLPGSEQSVSDLVDRRAERVVHDLGVYVERHVRVRVPHQLRDYLAGTPLSCDHDAQVRRNVSQVAFGSPSRSKLERSSAWNVVRRLSFRMR